eukprot:358478-Chlamydomonas_euryale.AAC.17
MAARGLRVAVSRKASAEGNAQLWIVMWAGVLHLGKAWLAATSCLLMQAGAVVGLSHNPCPAVDMLPSHPHSNGLNGLEYFFKSWVQRAEHRSHRYCIAPTTFSLNAIIPLIHLSSRHLHVHPSVCLPIRTHSNCSWASTICTSHAWQQGTFIDPLHPSIHPSTHPSIQFYTNVSWTCTLEKNA